MSLLAPLVKQVQSMVGRGLLCGCGIACALSLWSVGRYMYFAALERHLEYRIALVRRSWQVSRLAFRQQAHTPHKGYKFHLNTKRRISSAGEPVDYLACDHPAGPCDEALQGCRGQGRIPRTACRRTMASRLIEQGVRMETVQLLLGHAELDHVRPYLQVSHKRLEDMFREVI